MTADLQFTPDNITELDTAVSKLMIYGDSYTAVEQNRL
jgi:hypothetical protein